jgi:hypothetical protein
VWPAEADGGQYPGAREEGSIMPSFGPELIQTMRTALEEAMSRIPAEQVTPALKARVAEFILKTAAEGQTSYDVLLAAASQHIQTIMSLLA